jgi:hypothetical protein
MPDNASGPRNVSLTFAWDLTHLLSWPNKLHTLDAVSPIHGPLADDLAETAVDFVTEATSGVFGIAAHYSFTIARSCGRASARPRIVRTFAPALP